MALAPFFQRDPLEEFFAPFSMAPFRGGAGPVSALSTDLTAMPRGMAMDVVEHSDKFEVKADLPGMTKEDINVEVDGKVLTIKAEKKMEKKEEGPKEGEAAPKWHRYERSQSFVQRSVRLPDKCDMESIKARYENGVLNLDIPKKPENGDKGAKRIEVA